MAPCWWSARAAHLYVAATATIPRELAEFRRL
jgi:hypothetical protein